MEEEKVAEGERAETRANNSSSSLTKAGGGRPQGSKKLKVCVTDLNWTNLIAADCESTQHQEGGRASKLSEANHAKNPSETHRGRGRPKGSKKPASNEDGSIAEHFPKKRGRPKKVHPAGDLPNEGSNAPKRGRPKGSIKHKSETETGEEDGDSSATPRERGRPKCSPNKKPRLESSLSAGGGSDQKKNSQKKRRGRPRKAELTKSTFNGMTKTRGRPRKKHQESGNQEPLTDGSPPKKRGRGRPKGSLNKKPSGKLGRPPKVSALSAKGRKRGRPCQLPAKRGRPRKYPLPPPEELNKPKVWKPLGRPRKYPRVEPPEGTPAAPRRARGRPRKSESKKAAHLRKSIPTSPPALHGPSDGAQKKKGRPQNDAKREGDAPKKRGRPKGSVNKNKAPTPPSHSKAASDSSAVGERQEAEEEVEAVPADSSDSGEKQILRDSDVNFTRQNSSLQEEVSPVDDFLILLR